MQTKSEIERLLVTVSALHHDAYSMAVAAIDLPVPNYQPNLELGDLVLR